MQKRQFKDRFKIGELCGICGHRILRKSHMNLDHILPLSEGGNDDQSNYQYAHKWCNHLKGNKKSFKAPSFAWNIKCMALYELGLLRLN